MRLHGHAARPGSIRIVTGTAFGRHDLAWIRQHAPDDDSVRVDDVTSAYACIGIWGPASREIPLAALTVDPLDFRYMQAVSSRSGRSMPCSARHLRRRARLGALLPSSSASGCGRCSGRRGVRTGSLPAATRRSTRFGSRRAIASGARTSPPTTRRKRPGLGFAVSATRTSSARRRCSPAASRPCLACLTLADPRAGARVEPVRVGGLLGQVTGNGYGFTVERSIAYAYLPAASAGQARPSRWRSSASGSAARSRRSRCTTRAASACNKTGPSSRPRPAVTTPSPTTSSTRSPRSGSSSAAISSSTSWRGSRRGPP